ncbi:MAG TPA: PH domain-containing protein [Candidatus Saccharimonadales bacterium]|nr:PH domain-containing protein [Candidatus Saccharimonadales bacterium]
MDPNQQNNQQQPQQPDIKKLDPMVVLRPGERVICEIKRHPFGILSMYFSGLVAIVIAVVLAAFAPQIISTSTDISGMAMVGAGIVIVGVLLMLWVATFVYWQNRWIVTDDSITQITQDGLFGRRVSQLSMENLEDVTIDKSGIIQTMLNFGTLKAETAGERSKFMFPFCPDPATYARKILEVHETFIHQSRHQPQAVNPVTPMPSYSGGYQQQPPQQQPMPQQPAQQQWQQPMPSPPDSVQQFAPGQSQNAQQPQPTPQPGQDDQQKRSNPAIWGD